MPGKRVIGLIKADTLTDENKSKALYAINLIKGKRYRKKKGRKCDNDSKTRSSPRCPLQYHALVCIKKIVVIGPIRDKELIFIF